MNWKVDSDISLFKIEANKIETFEDFPLSKRTQQGLKSANYSKPTEIQRESIGITLKGFDLLGAAKTGSGKTLAFLIPVFSLVFFYTNSLVK